MRSLRPDGCECHFSTKYTYTLIGRGRDELFEPRPQRMW